MSICLSFKCFAAKAGAKIDIYRMETKKRSVNFFMLLSSTVKLPFYLNSIGANW